MSYLKKYGIKSVTMDEIAARLGISKKTIYQSFADKNELVSQIFDKHLCQNQYECLESAKKAENAIHEVLIWFQKHFVLLCNLSIRIFCMILKNIIPMFFKKITDFKNKFLYKQIFRNLQRGINEELYRKDINIEIITKLRLTSILFSTNTELFPAHQFKLADTEREIVTHFLSGIVTPKGIKVMKKCLLQLTLHLSVVN